jgi:hypothetical protein
MQGPEVAAASQPAKGQQRSGACAIAEVLLQLLLQGICRKAGVWLGNSHTLVTSADGVVPMHDRARSIGFVLTDS